jgi:nucleotide-binding universal stress UspA family protein
MINANATPGRIVVGVDGSEGCVGALRWAARWTEFTGDRIQAVHVWHIPVAVSLSFMATDWRPDQDAVCIVQESIAVAFPDDPAPKVELITREGEAAQVLEELSHGADLLVVGSRGHGEIMGAVLGSVSLHCTAHAACPVVVVRPGLPAETYAADLAISQAE